MYNARNSDNSRIARRKHLSEKRRTLVFIVPNKTNTEVNALISNHSYNNLLTS